MEANEIMSLPEGVKVKISNDYDCDDELKEGGTLVFQDEESIEDGEYCFGIEVDGECCFEIPPEFYILNERYITPNGRKR